MLKNNIEKNFQHHIIEKLTEQGYNKRPSEEYDKTFAVDKDCLWTFLLNTQRDTLDRLDRHYPDEAVDKIIEAANASMLKNNKVYTLKHGVKVDGLHFDLMYSKPATNLNPACVRNYEENVMSVMEEVRVSDSERVDIVLFLNGFAIVTAELKYRASGQSYKNAINQYKETRKESTKIFDKKTGAIVHFAMDDSEVYMTTRIEGKSTMFLPFNIGRGESIDTGAGNPECDWEYPTHYMYDKIWTKDSLIGLISDYIFFNGSKNIFPRYHQLDCVEKLVEAAKKNGTKKDYLIQHSAGSGKTNEIVWLGYELARLHDENDEPIFEAIIVMTDRIVIDKQLQEAFLLHEHSSGYVAVMDKSCTSKSLAESLKGNSRIIVTTIQKFPYVVDSLKELKGRYAVIIDEAHSSTSGEDMLAVKTALGEMDIEDVVNDKMENREPNIAMFAFTATPKQRTLKMFGEKTADGKYKPFHVYSMKQAVDEGFIVDVTLNYVKYSTYYHVSKNTAYNPKCNKIETTREINNIVSRDEANIKQRVSVFLSFFVSHIKNQLDGRGKAMIICSSREQAVLMKLVVDKALIEDKIGTKALVAFSGEVEISGNKYSETSMNGFSDSKTAAMFDTDEYGIMIVADKYQTGYDQPKLCGMFVNKKLHGVNAVQTLSRLNRVCSPYQKQTYIVDFENSYEDIKNSFAPYFTSTVMVTAKVNDLENLKKVDKEIENTGVLVTDEIDRFYDIHVKPVKDSRDCIMESNCIDGAFRRMNAILKGESKNNFKNKLNRFLNLYLAVRMTNAEDLTADLHKKYEFLKVLSKFIAANETKIIKIDDIESLIEIDDVSQRKEKEEIKEGLTDGCEIEASGTGTGLSIEDKEELLSDIINDINVAVGKKFNGDVIIPYIMRIKNVAKNDKIIRDAAKVNNINGFESAFFNWINEFAIGELLKIVTCEPSAAGEVEETEDEKKEREEFLSLLVSDDEAVRRIFKMFVGEVMENK